MLEVSLIGFWVILYVWIYMLTIEHAEQKNRIWLVFLVSALLALQAGSVIRNLIKLIGGAR